MTHSLETMFENESVREVFDEEISTIEDAIGDELYHNKSYLEANGPSYESLLDAHNAAMELEDSYDVEQFRNLLGEDEKFGELFPDTLELLLEIYGFEEVSIAFSDHDIPI